MRTGFGLEDPAVPPFVTLGLTVVYTVFYSLLFIFIYVQLWLVLRYRHKRFSYQTVFLFLCLLWSALRTVLFSFYFRNFVTANTLGPFPFWLLYCFPVCLQFFTLSLMNLYFAQVVFKAKSKYAPELQRYSFLAIIWFDLRPKLQHLLHFQLLQFAFTPSNELSSLQNFFLPPPLWERCTKEH
uniref:G protein-coupled receptor 137Ba n=1 Tax=Xiphophorus couchianus TaxID=32473 RepID=A0A3B5LDZ4_9TELE